MSVAITADQLTKEIKGRKIVNQLSFTINKGEVFGLLGPNGAGKTTTIETLLGIKRPDYGSIASINSRSFEFGSCVAAFKRTGKISGFIRPSDRAIKSRGKGKDFFFEGATGKRC